MYQEFYGLHSAPFELTLNPKGLLLTPTHREALSMLEYGITARKGIMLLVGEAGTGKTTLLRKVLSMRLGADRSGGAAAVYISHPTLSHDEFFQQLAEGFDLSRAAGSSKATMLKDLQRVLVTRCREGRSTALIVDEAQCVSTELMEELRLLANIELDETKLLPLILAGQPELAERLNDHGLRQLKQRIVMRCQLNALDLQETATYIFGRMRLAGGDATRVFTREAVIAVHHASSGIPRTINVICDNVLLAGFAQQRRRVGADVVTEVCRDLDVRGIDRPSSGARAPGDLQAAIAQPGSPPRAVLSRADRTGS